MEARRLLILGRPRATALELVEVSWSRRPARFCWRQRTAGYGGPLFPEDDRADWRPVEADRLEFEGIALVACFHGERPDLPVLVIDGTAGHASALLRPDALAIHATLRTALLRLPTAEGLPPGEGQVAEYRRLAGQARDSGAATSAEARLLLDELERLHAHAEQLDPPRHRYADIAAVEARLRETARRILELESQRPELRALADALLGIRRPQLHLVLDASQQAGRALPFFRHAMVAPGYHQRSALTDVDLADFPRRDWGWQSDGTAGLGIPLAVRLGIETVLPPRRMWRGDAPGAGAEDLHWLRRLEVGFAHGPPLPARAGHDATPPTLELVLARGFRVPAPAATATALPLPLEPAGNPEPASREENDGHHGVPVLRFVERQPPLWCAQARRVGDPVPWAAAIEGIGARALARLWAEGIAGPFHRALVAMRGDRPLSLLPRLDALWRRDGQGWRRLDDREVQAGDPTWTAVFRLVDGAPAGSAEVRPDDLGLDLVHLAPGSLERLWAGRESEPLLARLALERFLDGDGRAVIRFADLGAVVPRFVDGEARSASEVLSAALGPAARPLTLIDLALRERAPPEGQGDAPTVHLGAFALDLPAAADGGGRPGRLALWPGEPSARPHLSLELRWAIALADFRPVAQDRAPGEDRGAEPPVLIDPPLAPEATGAGFSLHVLEETRSGQRVRLEVHGDRSGIPARTVHVLDGGPFLIAEVVLPEILPDEAGGALASFDTDGIEGTAWQIRTARGGYVLRLPPQGIGESTLRPGSPEGTRHADFRFSPPARLHLFTTFRRGERALVEPPTNTRRLFGDATQRAPGAPVASLEAELLYGMPLRVGDRSDLMLAELTADFGLIPPELDARPPWSADEIGELGDDDPYLALRRAWRRARRAFAHRLGVLALRRIGASEGAVLETGVSFRLRPEAEIRRPVPMPGPGTRQHSPYAGGEVQGAPRSPAPDWGLDGGADWGFESVLVYESLWRRPVSDQGQLGGLALSALGGWGEQRASFDNRRTTIAASTAMGRTHHYVLERVGRIGAFWNRAKHVIVYERSVLPGDQFRGSAPDEAGRPFLRKIKEYVEILEPERRFPDFGEPEAVAGCVRGIVFRSTELPVDSAWGEDLPGEGWRVALWNPAEDERVYPRPQIELQIATDPESGAAVTATALLDPDQLVFFTSTREGLDDDTDAWPAVEGVDYVDVPTPHAPALPTHVAQDADAPMPAAAAVEGGLAALTFAVEPLAERPADLMAGRDAPAVVAALANVTMMRAAPGGGGEAGQAAGEALGLRGTVETVMAELSARVREAKDHGIAGARRRLEEELDRLAGRPELARARAALDRVVAVGGGFDVDPCPLLVAETERVLDETAERLGRDLARLRTRLEGGLAAALAAPATARDELKRALGLWFERAGLLLGGLPLPLAGIDQELRRLGRGPVGPLIAERIASLRAQLRQAAGGGRTLMLAAFDDLAARLLAALDGEAERTLAVLSRRLPKAADHARELADQAGEELRRALAAARRRLGEADDDGAIDRAFADLDTAAAAAAGRVDDGLREVAGALAEARGEAARAVAALRARIEAIRDEALGKIDTTDPGERLRRELLAASDRAIAEIVATVAARGEVRAALIAQVRGFCESWGGTFESLLTAARGQVGGAEALVARLREALAADSVEDMLARIERGGQGALQALDSFAERALGTLRERAREAGLPLGQAGATTLRMVRAFGDAPVAPALAFNRARVAYYFDRAAGTVGTTPMTALVDRIGDGLKPFGLRIPTDAVSGRLVPRLPDDFDLAQLFPDIAGLKLDTLFRAARLPRLRGDQIVIEHRVDPDTRRAWLQAEADVPLSRRERVLEVGPVGLALANGRFHARARVEGGPGEQIERQSAGRLDGDWEMTVAGQELVAFVDTPLLFDGSRLRFDIAPERVRLSGAVRFLGELMSRLAIRRGGLAIRPITEQGLPVGVLCTLDKPLPPLQAGAFGISGLRLGVGLGLRALDAELRPDFGVQLTFSLGRKVKPFTITVYALGGAGWLETRTTYAPLRGEVRTRVDIAIGAAAALAFAVGPLRGDVQLFFGIVGRIDTGTGGTSFTVTVTLSARGRVTIRGLVTIGLDLVLEVTIHQGGRVEGRGHVAASIRIGFIRIRVSQRVHYVFASGAGESPAGLVAAAVGDWRDLVPAALAYVESLA
jgi:hypothetical protein